MIPVAPVNFMQQESARATEMNTLFTFQIIKVGKWC